MTSDGLTAAMLVGQRRVEFTTADRPVAGPGQLVIRNRANAICGSDRHGFLAGTSTVAGHETAGEVVDRGPDTTTPIGARGVIYLMAYCGRCRNCAAGATNVCLDKRGDMGFTRDGGLGPYEVIEETMFFPIEDAVAYPMATMLLDVMGTSGHALDRALLVQPDIRSLYIAGAGPVGLGLLVMSKIRFGADFPVTISDISRWRLDFAESLGGRPIEAGGVESMPRVDVAVDASGRGAARRAAVRRLNRRGVLVCVGHGEDLTVDVSPDLIANEAAVLGSEYFPYDDLARNAGLLREHGEYIAKVVTHVFDISEAEKAFEVFFGGESGKVVVTQD